MPHHKGVKYISEISLIGLVNWVLGLEKGTYLDCTLFHFIYFAYVIPLQKSPSRNHE